MINVAGRYVSLGWIDIHVHVFPGVFHNRASRLISISHFPVEFVGVLLPQHTRPKGATTILPGLILHPLLSQLFVTY